MKITRWKKEGKTNQFVSLSEREALLLIESLILQIKNRSANSGRWETTDDKGGYFTISVVPEEISTCVCPEKAFNNRLHRQIHKIVPELNSLIEKIKPVKKSKVTKHVR